MIEGTMGLLVFAAVFGALLWMGIESADWLLVEAGIFGLVVCLSAAVALNVVHSHYRRPPR